jgi:hypothetical protein
MVGSAQKRRAAYGVRQRSALQVGFALGVAAVCFALGALPSPVVDPPRELDPSAWGSDHAGKAIPESVTDDECLFCHRAKIGPAWPQNRHQSTIRNIDAEALALLKSSETHAPFGEAVEYVLGRTNQWRLLKRSGAYGRLDMLSTRVHPTSQKAMSRFADSGAPHWEPDTFANRCAGCHTTGVDSRNKTFSAISVGCFSCHG